MSPMLSPWEWLHLDGAPVPSLTLLLLPLLVLAALRISRGTSTRGRRLPPSPPKLPLIGNLHQLGSCPHRSLVALSREHGPLMLLQLGQTPTLVVSSGNMAELIMKTHDTIFANRPQLEAGKQILYGCRDLAFSPYGEYWRNLRKIFNLHLLGTSRVQTYELAREEEVAFMIKEIEQLSLDAGVVDLSGVLQDFMHNFILRIVCGRRVRDEGLHRVFREAVEEHTPLFSRFHVGDYFPSLRWISVFTRLDSALQRSFKRWDQILDGVIDKHLNQTKNGHEPDQEDFVDVLLALQKDSSTEFPLSVETIKAIMIDTVAAGTETSQITLEWAMVELIRKPEVMKKAHLEVRTIAGAKQAVAEPDIAHMKYLKAVIKETLRLHPPATLLMPHLSSEDTKICGYDVPKQTTVLINAWAIMRDPAYWETPEEFRPERFLGASVDFRGQDFVFIPFGAGRRICPGMQLAVSVVEVALANLLHRFDWELPDGMRGEDLDMSETFGVVTHRKLRLHLVPIPRAL